MCCESGCHPGGLFKSKDRLHNTSSATDRWCLSGLPDCMRCPVLLCPVPEGRISTVMYNMPAPRPPARLSALLLARLPARPPVCQVVLLTARPTDRPTDILSHFGGYRMGLALMCAAGGYVLEQAPFVTRPWPVPGNIRFTTISTSSGHFCGIDANQDAWCYGTGSWIVGFIS